jgi:tRNA dimethylallyltransferase
MKVLALFGPTAVGKTGIAIEIAERLRQRGEDPVAVNCDAIQLYRGLEILSGAAGTSERERLDHRLLSFVEPAEEFSAGRYAELAHAEIDALLGEGRRPIVVGGTGLYLRAALAELDLRPPVPPEIRDRVEEEIDERGPASLHAELDPDLAQTVEPTDRKRVARLTELARAGIVAAPNSERLWTADLRHPTLLVGLTMDRELLAQRISSRVESMISAGAAEEVRETAEAGPSRTARAALGFEQLLVDMDASPTPETIESIKAAHRSYARRQLTWMRRMEGVLLVDRTGGGDREVAEEILGHLDEAEGDT